ncbi:acyltransferase family protein [Bosea sp. TAF32]|uniref:acyltransferase family protein n=1 Tax=Bosea sp. TAF32 TaxID=3237482 RepID=UPI003F91A0FB
MASALDLTRWAAALLVLIYHVRENVLVPAADTSESLRSALVSIVYLVTNCGDQAVTWFFITSGFLVGGSAVSDIVSGRFEGRHYLVNRISRIYAVYLPALALGFTLDLIRVGQFGISLNAGGETVASYSALTVILNVLNLQTILAPTIGSNIPLWSIAYEMFYYLTFPFIFIAFWRGRLDLRITFIIALYFVIVFKNNPSVINYFFIWVLGAVVRFMPRLIFASPILAWAAAVAACFSFPALATLLGGGAKIVLGLAFANALLAARFSNSPVLLKIAPINALLASFSFSLYVLHAPALHFILALANGRADSRLSLQPSGWEGVSWGVGLTVALVLYAFAFSLFTERKTHVVRAFLERQISGKCSDQVRAIKTR